MTLDTLAEKYRLKVTRNESGDKIIQGRRGQLYMDAGKTCAIWIDAPPMQKNHLTALGGKLWQGDISLNRRGYRTQDARVTGIAADKIPLAIRLTGCKYKRIISEAQAAVLERIASTRFKPKGAGA